jgi:hypothetical protein
MLCAGAETDTGAVISFSVVGEHLDPTSIFVSVVFAMIDYFFSRKVEPGSLTFSSFDRILSSCSSNSSRSVSSPAIA